MTEIEKQIITKLEALSDESYRDFNAKLIPNINNVLGIRIPVLRHYARELYGQEEIDINAFLKINNDKYMEFTMLQGFITGLKKSAKAEFFADIKTFIPKINNWAVCDTFCASLKQTKKYLPETFEFLQPYLQSQNTYELRFGVVMLLTYYITDDYIDRVLEILTTLSSSDYYAQMGIAWALSICYVNYFDKTHAVVSGSNLSFEIKNKTVRKVIESLRPAIEQKNFLKNYIKQQNINPRQTCLH